VKPDVLHHHNIAGFGPFILGIKAPKVLYTAHDYWLVCPMNGLKKHDGTYCTFKHNCSICSVFSKRPLQLWRYNISLYKYIKHVDNVITPSDYMKEKLKEFGLKGNFTTIPNFVAEPLKTGSPIYKFPYFFFVGILEEHKGILNLVSTFVEIKDEVSPKLVIAGSGSLENEIKEIISKIIVMKNNDAWKSR